MIRLGRNRHACCIKSPAGVVFTAVAVLKVQLQYSKSTAPAVTLLYLNLHALALKPDLTHDILDTHSYPCTPCTPLHLANITGGCMY